MIKYQAGKPETKTFTVLPKGVHSFTVVDAKSDTSKSGNDMVVVTLKHASGTLIYNSLVLAQSSIWKFHQFVKAVGQDPESGNFDETDCIGATVEARLGIDPAKGEYAERNKVEAYIFEEGF